MDFKFLQSQYTRVMKVSNPKEMDNSPFDYCVVRMHCLMEDEGFSHFFESFPLLEEAKEYIKSICGPDQYFQEFDYQIFKKVEDESYTS